MRHATITFLEDKEALRVVDSEFRELVKLFHQIPYCATFGVSCAGHCRKIDKYRFWPVLFGHLNIIIFPGILHIDLLLEVIHKMVSTHSDVSFYQKEHTFGPPENSRLQIWEIRIGDNHCLDVLEPDYRLQFLEIAKYAELHKKAMERYSEIQLFWLALAEAVSTFCQRFNFWEFAPEKRVKEFAGVWQNKKRKQCRV